MKALKIALDSMEVVEINGYDELKAHLDGGWIEGLRLSDDAFAYVDEEGIMKGLPYNAVATEGVCCVSCVGAICCANWLAAPGTLPRNRPSICCF